MTPSTRRSIEDQVVYEVVLDADSTVRFHVVAESATTAMIEALDKIGYHIVIIGGAFALVDADDEDDVEATLESTTLIGALEEAFIKMGWTFTAHEYSGGALGAGFGEVDE